MKVESGAQSKNLTPGTRTREFHRLLTRIQVARPVPMKAVPPNLFSGFRGVQVQADALQASRKQSVASDDGRHERRSDFDRMDHSEKKSVDPDAQRSSSPRPDPVHVQGSPASQTEGSSTTRSSQVTAAAGSAMAALVKRIQTFQREGIPTLQVSFALGRQTLASVHLKKTGTGEVTVQMTPAGSASRAQLAEYTRTLRQRLQDRGLRVGALIIG